MSIDVEGSELAAMRTLDLTRTRVGLLLLERPTAALRQLLEDSHGLECLLGNASSYRDALFAPRDSGWRPEVVRAAACTVAHARSTGARAWQTRRREVAGSQRREARRREAARQSAVAAAAKAAPAPAAPAPGLLSRLFASFG